MYAPIFVLDLQTCYPIFRYPMIIKESQRIYLRDIKPSDTDAIFSYRSLNDVAKYQYWKPYTREDALKFVEQCKDPDLNLRNEWIGLAVILKNTDRLIGDCSIKMNDKNAEVGCNIAPEYQHQGYAKEVLNLLLEICFNDSAIQEVSGIVDSENMTSIRLMESVGMSKLPDYEERIICKGEWCVEHKYVISASDYRRITKS